jgi:hypothetical protein
MKWTQASNLLTRAKAPSPSVLVAALEAVCLALIDDQLIIKDIIPNARWSCVTLSHVLTGKDPDTTAHSPEAIHDKLSTHNPNYAALTICQLPSWVCDPKSFKDGQVSSVSFAFEDPTSTASLDPCSPLLATSGAPSRPGFPRRSHRKRSSALMQPQATLEKELPANALHCWRTTC